MIFSELYSVYYNAVAALLSEVIRGEREEKILRETVSRYAFSESGLTIFPALRSGAWQLLTPEGETPLRKIPTMPMTLLQRRWLKALSLDPRVALFDLKFEGLEDVEPLFTPADYAVYDRYGDGDPYEDEGYRRRFRTVLSALREKRALRITAVNRQGRAQSRVVTPLRLEYSEKDDKFRLIAMGFHGLRTVNLGRTVSCRICEGGPAPQGQEPERNLEEMVLRIRNERNTLERCLLHFAHFEKRVERQSEGEYRLYLRYDREDESEIVIRALSFGPTVEVLAPAELRRQICERIQKQMGLFFGEG